MYLTKSFFVKLRDFGAFVVQFAAFCFASKSQGLLRNHQVRRNISYTFLGKRFTAEFKAV
jgi:hypothetical protein